MTDINKKPYKITWDLRSVRHLSGSLYSSAPAVLTEVVANAWDADATKINITIDEEKKYIEFSDDGIGMSVDDINNKYLCVGYQRRGNKVREDTRETRTAGGRIVMGRKGLGKLALFYLAKTIEIHTVKNGEAHGFRMNLDDIEKMSLEKIGDENKIYYPEPLTKNEIKNVKRGTVIRLEGIERKRLDLTIKALRKRLAYRFSILEKRNDFKICLNDKEITYKDRDELNKSEFVWTIGNHKELPPAFKNLKITALEGKLEKWEKLNDWEPEWEVSGWIATVSKPKDLTDSDIYNFNKIIVFARGRLFQEDILGDIVDNRLYKNYLIGQIDVNFLDQDNLPDIATSNRQRVQEEDSRYKELIKFLRVTLLSIEKEWTGLRNEKKEDKTEKSFPELKRWTDSYSERPKIKKAAKDMIEKLTFLPIEKEKERALVYKHGILAFERMLLNDSYLELIDNLNNPEKLLELLADRNSLENTMYGVIVKNRLEVIQKFISNVDKNKKEKIIQNYLFKNLWLLDPTWERIAESARVETQFKMKLEKEEKDEDEDQIGRIDITYRTISSKHLIIELKRPERNMNLDVLVIQGKKYFNLLKYELTLLGVKKPEIEINFILGKPLKEETENPDSLKHSLLSISSGSRVLYYETLIKSAENAYAEYLKHGTKIEEINKIIANLNESD